MEGLGRDIVMAFMVKGWNCSSLGYMVNGERVPEVITTVWNRLKMRFIAMDASRKLHLIKKQH